MAVTVAATAMSLGGVTPAHAQDCTPGGPYPPAQCTVSISTTTPTIGGTITVSGSGFAPNSSVTIQLLSNPVTLAIVTADGSGNVTAQVVIPEVRPGSHTITLTGVNPDGTARVLSVSIVVYPERCEPGGHEPSGHPGGHDPDGHDPGGHEHHHCPPGDQPPSPPGGHDPGDDDPGDHGPHGHEPPPGHEPSEHVAGETAHTGLSGTTQIEVLSGVLLGAGTLTLLLVRRRRRADAD